VNGKIPGQPRPVTLVELNERRYNPSDFRELLDSIDAAAPLTKTPAATSGICAL